MNMRGNTIFITGGRIGNRELGIATEAAAIGFSKRTLAASWTETARAIFSKLNS
jgi:hypothetical protein